MGTNISTTISGSGTFVLKGVPSGSVHLHFSGQGFDGTVPIHDVGAEHIQITVRITVTVVIESIVRMQPGNTADVEGVIASISHGDRSMKVNGLEIKVWDAPIWQGSTRVGISMLNVGDRVRVKGNSVHDYIVAIEVIVHGFSPSPTPPPDTTTPPGPTPAPTPPPAPPGGGGDGIEGVIQTISHGDRSMKINGIEIKIWDAPVYRGSSRVGISELAVGQRVRVKGNWVHDYIVATEVIIL